MTSLCWHWKCGGKKHKQHKITNRICFGLCLVPPYLEHDCTQIFEIHVSFSSPSSYSSVKHYIVLVFTHQCGVKGSGKFQNNDLPFSMYFCDWPLTHTHTLTVSQSQIQFLPEAQDDPQRRRPDIRKAKMMLGWEPVVCVTHNRLKGSQTVTHVKHTVCSVV